MTPVTALEVTGTALYGTRWRAPLARGLRRPGADRPGVDVRLLHHWLQGTPGRGIPSWVPDALVELLVDEADRRRLMLGDLADSIKQQLAA
jgi:hypothetical protein